MSTSRRSPLGAGYLVRRSAAGRYAAHWCLGAEESTDLSARPEESTDLSATVLLPPPRCSGALSVTPVRRGRDSEAASTSDAGVTRLAEDATCTRDRDHLGSRCQGLKRVRSDPASVIAAGARSPRLSATIRACRPDGLTGSGQDATEPQGRHVANLLLAQNDSDCRVVEGGVRRLESLSITDARLARLRFPEEGVQNRLARETVGDTPRHEPRVSPANVCDVCLRWRYYLRGRQRCRGD